MNLLPIISLTVELFNEYTFRYILLKDRLLKQNNS